jgi:hypothetical protein
LKYPDAGTAAAVIGCAETRAVVEAGINVLANGGGDFGGAGSGIGTGAQENRGMFLCFADGVDKTGETVNHATSA